MSRRVILWYLLGGIVMAASSPLALSQEKPSTNRAPASTDTSVVISVPRDGEFYFGVDRITQTQIPERLKVAFRAKPQEDRMVYIRAGQDVTYKTVVSVIDTIRDAGFNQIALVTNADSDSRPQAKSPTRAPDKAKKVRVRRRTYRRASK